ncbi:MAG: hypothetical protein ACK5Z5_06665 [Neisseriaceae bacterium]|jgi:hypothetical protein
MAQLLIHVSDRLVNRFRSLVPAKQRSKYIENLLENSLKKEDEILLNCARQIESDEDINELIYDFNNTSGDVVYE